MISTAPDTSGKSRLQSWPITPCASSGVAQAWRSSLNCRRSSTSRVRSATSASTRLASACRPSRSPLTIVLRRAAIHSARARGCRSRRRRHLGPRLEVALGQPAGRGGDQLDPAEDDPLAAEPDGGDRRAYRRAPGRGGSRRGRGRPRQRRRCAATRRSGRRAGHRTAPERARSEEPGHAVGAHHLGGALAFSATVAVTTGASGRGWPTHRHGSGCRARIVPRSSERATAQSTGRSAAANRPTQPRSSAANTTNCVPPPEYGIGSDATSCGLPVTGSISWSPS